MTSLASLLKEYAAPATATSGLAGYDLEGQRRAKRRRLGVQLRMRMVKGDVPGHEFHGNQYSEGGGTHEEWKQAQEYEGRLFGGAYNWTRVEGPRGGSSHKTSPMRAMIMAARPRYNALREKFGLKPVTDWTTRPPRDQLVQFIPPPTKKMLKQLLTDRAAHQAATSPLNLKPQPTEDQKHAGNYPKGHLRIAGMDISIENPAGSHRRPEWPELKSHYGYIRRTEGADGDHVDCFVRTGCAEDYAGPVHVVNQVKPDGSFDEHKVILGHETAEGARTAYLENYERGWQGLGSMVSLPIDEFKAWLAEGDTTKPLKAANSLSRLLLSQVRRFV